MDTTAIALLAALCGLASGVLLAWTFLKGRIADAHLAGQQSTAIELAQHKERARALEDERRRVEAAHAGELAELARAREQAAALLASKAQLEARLDEERKQAAEKLELLDQSREALTNQFKVLANEILEEKSRTFTEQNKQNLDQVLEPFKAQLQEFKGRVETFHESETKDRVALKEQVQQLLGMNQRLSQDAHELTAALKGSNKAQGNWGELVLERILESAGLRKGHEYDTQESHTRDDGTRAQPDVVVHLPENKHLVVDSKVSLLAYQAAVGATSEAEREEAVKAHLASVRAHIKGLSDKSYQELYGIESPDFVVMFVPVEPAFMLAIQADANLWQEAWNKNVLLVSPSTLLFVVRTVAHLWRQEQQTRNAQDIARRGAALYDKFAAFVGDLENVGKCLGKVQDAYDGARKKLSEGPGNLIRQVEMLRQLGVKPNKALPQELVQPALEEPLELPVGRIGEVSKA